MRSIVRYITVLGLSAMMIAYVRIDEQHQFHRSLLLRVLLDDPFEDVSLSSKPAGGIHLNLDVTAFNQLNIERAAPFIAQFHPRLLVFDGNAFSVYNLEYKGTNYAPTLKYCGRCVQMVPLMINALKTRRPDRFIPGKSPVFQMLFMDSDSFTSPICINTPSKCPLQDFPPIPVFGSVPNPTFISQEAGVVPYRYPFSFLKAMPNWFFLSCMYNWRINQSKEPQCSKWNENIRPEEVPQWENLKPTIVWRGSDFSFLSHYQRFRFNGLEQIFDSADYEDEQKEGESVGGLSSSSSDNGSEEQPIQLGNLTDEIISQTIEQITPPMSRGDTLLKLFHFWNDLPPRWRAVALSLQAEYNNQTWFDCKFTTTRFTKEDRKTLARKKLLGHVMAMANLTTAPETMTPQTMSSYRYQLDLGGGGGTSWRGTLTKLLMPGSVLFHHVTPTMDWFYSKMLPWVHYIPVHWDLSDLKAKYDWAEANQDRARQIGKRGRELAKHLLSSSYMHQVWSDLFLNYMGQVIQAHDKGTMDPADSSTPTLSWDDRLRQYEKASFRIYPIISCDNVGCKTQVEKHKYVERYRHKQVDKEYQRRRKNNNHIHLQKHASSTQ